VVIASGLPRRQLLIQSFIPANLDVAKRRLPRVPTSLLTFPAGSTEITIAKDNGYTWLSPQWPFTAAFVGEAHRAGKRVAPYTVNTSADVKAAALAKVDALITDDPLMAATAVGLRAPKRLKTKFRHDRGGVTAGGRVQLPRGVPRRKGCKGKITLRVLGAGQAVRQASVRMETDCTYFVALPLPRKWPAHPQATIGFGGNDFLLPQLNAPRSLP
jgi:hypothetical protein